MYYSVKVKIPIIQGKIIKKNKGTTSYILYEYGRYYNPEKKYNVPKRAIIGKAAEEDSAMMYPNENFQKYFPDEVVPEELHDADRSCCLKIGPYIVINKVLQQYKIPEMLKAASFDDYKLIQDLVSYLIIDEENAGQYYPDYAYDHPLFSDKMHIYSASKITRLLQSVTAEKMQKFLNAWNEHRERQQMIYVSYDSTNKNCQAGDIDILEFGKAKDDRGTPIFNLSIAFDCTNRVPLFYEEYPGSITDVSELSFMVDKVKDYGYSRMGIILDRGYFCKENIQYIDQNKFEFIIMVKGCKALVSELINEKRNTFEAERSCGIRSYRVYGTTVKHTLFEDDKKERYFHIYYNPGKQAGEREVLEDKIEKYADFLKKHEGEKTTFGRTYTHYFNIHYDSQGALLYAKEKSDVITRELQLCGYFCIITSEKMTAEEALVRYKGRDISEKLFRTDKTFIDSRSMRVQSAESMSAKIFIEFLALIVRNRIYNLLREQMLKMDTKQNYLTVPAALRELEKIEMAKRGNGIYRLDHAITKKQKTICAAFGLDETDILQAAENIGKTLKKAEQEKTGEENDGKKESNLDD